MKKQHRTAKESYRIRTHLIHGNHESKHWDFDHHLVPPISASAAYRLGSAHRGLSNLLPTKRTLKGTSRFTFMIVWMNRPAGCSRNTWPMPKEAKPQLH